MKPGHVNFFDGMRVSAEHMDHLQGSLHSAIADLRAVAGAGTVHEGLDVVGNDDGTITVQPGLAFDFEQNRIVCQEPQQITPEFVEGTASAYVCIEYSSESTGLVDDVPTLIWDGCRVVVRPDLPTPESNQVPLARLQRLGDGVALEVSPIRVANGLPADPPGNGNGSRPADGGGEAIDTIETSPALRVRQGTAVLRPANGGLALGAFARRLGDAASAETSVLDTPGVTALPIGSELVQPGFPWRSLHCHGVIKVGWNPNEADDDTGGLVGTIHGEASRDSDVLMQGGVWTARTGSRLSADSLVRLPLRAVPLPDGPDSGILAPLIERMELRLHLAADVDAGFELRMDVRWTGGPDEEALRVLTESARNLAWDIELLWKVLG